MFKPANCKTTTFQASFFSWVVKRWNTLCRLTTCDKFSSLIILRTINTCITESCKAWGGGGGINCQGWKGERIGVNCVGYYLCATYLSLLDTTFDFDMPCTVHNLHFHFCLLSIFYSISPFNYYTLTTILREFWFF